VPPAVRPGEEDCRHGPLGMERVSLLFSLHRVARSGRVPAFPEQKYSFTMAVTSTRRISGSVQGEAEIACLNEPVSFGAG
jgi:hypothetical protein